MHQRVTIGLSADIWAAGCCFFPLFSEPRSGFIRHVDTYQQACDTSIPETIVESLSPMIKKRVDFFLKYDQDASGLVIDCLNPIPARRISAKNLTIRFHEIWSDKFGNAAAPREDKKFLEGQA